MPCTRVQGWIDRSIHDRTKALLEKAKLPVTVPAEMTVGGPLCFNGACALCGVSCACCQVRLC